MPRELPRILLILTEFPPRIGGMQTHAIHLARHLYERGYAIEVVTYKSGTRIEDASSGHHDDELGFVVHRVLSRLGHFHNLDLLEELAQRFAPDLVYGSTVFYGELSRRLGVPVVSRSVGNDVLRPWIVYPFRPLSRLVSTTWFERYLYRWFRRIERPELVEAAFRRKRRKLMIDSARQMTRVLANSDFTAGELRAIDVPADRVQVLSGGVDSARFSGPAPQSSATRHKLGIPADRFVMLTVCRLERKKGLDFLIASMPSVLERFPEAQLIIVGGGRRERGLRRLAEASTARERITFAGRIPHDEVADYYRIADVFVLASRVQIGRISGLRDAETMGRVLCEANAAGLAVVASRSGGIPSVIRDGDNGLLFDSDDEDDLIRALLALRSDPDATARRVRRGKEMAKNHFDWSVVVDEHVRCFAELAGQRDAVVLRAG